jgi:hypothetical protein
MDSQPIRSSATPIPPPGGDKGDEGPAAEGEEDELQSYLETSVLNGSGTKTSTRVVKERQPGSKENINPAGAPKSKKCKAISDEETPPADLRMGTKRSRGMAEGVETSGRVIQAS